MQEEITTNTLTDILTKTHSDAIDNYLEQYTEGQEGGKVFANYMRALLKEKKLTQQEVFIAADISEGYGYKLIAQEKHTKQRDVILRLCFAARCNLKEVNRALKLYGMSPLYPRIARDAVLIIAFNRGLHDLADVDELLISHGMEILGTQNTEI